MFVCMSVCGRVGVCICVCDGVRAKMLVLLFCFCTCACRYVYIYLRGIWRVSILFVHFLLLFSLSCFFFFFASSSSSSSSSSSLVSPSCLLFVLFAFLLFFVACLFFFFFSSSFCRSFVRSLLLLQLMIGEQGIRVFCTQDYLLAKLLRVLLMCINAPASSPDKLLCQFNALRTLTVLLEKDVPYLLDSVLAGEPCFFPSFFASLASTVSLPSSLLFSSLLFSSLLFSSLLFSSLLFSSLLFSSLLFSSISSQSCLCSCA
jgi:hypothetical protein